MEVKVNVDGQKLKVATNLKTFISGTQEFIKFTFNFMDDAWNNLTIFAQFKQGNNAYNQYLDGNNSVYLPYEIEPGECSLSLHGNHGNVIALTDSIKLSIKKDSFTSNGESTDISQSLYQQLVTKIGNETLKTKSQTITGAINELYDMIQSINSASL